MTAWLALRRAMRALLLSLAALVIFIEEWGWRPLSAALARIARWPPLARLEALIAKAPPRLALVLFVVPAVALFPVKLAALWLIHEGQATLGVLVIVAAKLLGTALVGRLFVLTKDQLMQFAWFARTLGWWIATKARIGQAVRRTWAWRAARVVKHRARAAWRRFAR